MIKGPNKYTIREDLKKLPTNTLVVLDKLYDVLSKQWELQKNIKDCREELIKNIVKYEASTEEIEDWFSKLDPIVLQVSPNTFDIQVSIDTFENLKENYEKNIKIPWFWKKILKFFFKLDRKIKEKKRPKHNLWIKGFWNYIENENEEWVNNIDNNYDQQFVNLYKRNILDYLTRINDIPSLKEMLKTTFCMAIKQNIIDELNNTNFEENECKEAFWIINDYLLEKWITIEPSDNIKDSFINECRKHYPLSKKTLNHLFENKTFKNTIIKKITSSIEWDIEQVFEKLYKDMERLLIKDNLERRYSSMWLFLSNVLWKYQEFKDSSNRKADMISLYFLAIADKFEEDHLKKLNRKEDIQTQTKKKEDEESPTIYKIFNSEKKEVKIDKKIEENIDKAISIIWWTDEEKSSMKRYLTNLYKKWLPINFSHFMRIFNIKWIPPKVENIILDKIGMEFESEEEIKQEKRTPWEIIKQENNIEEEIQEIENPIEYMTNNFKDLWYIFINEDNFQEQAEEYCKNNSQKTILKNLLSNPKFWKVLLHKAGCKEIRVLPVAKTWRRILMVKIDDKIYIDWCYNHNDYEQRLDLIKKGKVKLKRLIK